MSLDGKNLGGSCKCGKIMFILKSIPNEIANCHCTICQKLHGLSFVGFAKYLKEDVCFTNVDYLKTVRTSNRATRNMCKKCSTFLFMHYNFSENIWLCVDTFNFDTDKVEHYDIYTNTDST